MKPNVIKSSGNPSWREVLHELKAFAMRDLQDYRLVDYAYLSRKSRYLLLTISLPLLVCVIIFLWRVLLGEQWLSQERSALKVLEGQVIDISRNIDNYEQFLAKEELQFLLKRHTQLEGEREDINDFSETSLVTLVESLVVENQLQLMMLSPKREMMMIDHLLLKKNSSNRSLKQGGKTDLITRLRPISDLLKMRFLDADNLDTEELLGIPKLEVTLLVCGDYSQVLPFLWQLQQDITQFSALLYLDILALRDSPPECSKQTYQLVLQFYAKEVIHKAYLVLATHQQGETLVPMFPQTLAQMTTYLTQLRDVNAMNVEIYNSIEYPEKAIISLFRGGTIEGALNADDGFLGKPINRSDHLGVWPIGKFYRGMFLAGIVVQSSGAFAVVKMPTGKWQRLEEGEFNILEIGPREILIDPSSWE